MHSYVYDNGDVGVTQWQTFDATPINTWHFIEVLADQRAGEQWYTIRVNGQYLVNRANTAVAGKTWNWDYVWVIGFDEADNPWPTIWLDDIYIDRDWNRVMLGNASTFGACTRFEMQPATVWADSSVSVTVNQGAYTNGQQAWIYLFDTANTSNTTGFPITINSGSTVIVPDSAFTAAPTSGQSPLLVNFTDQSTNTPTGWAWSFGANATPATSTAQNPSTTYGAGGAKTVTLAASNSAGTDATPASTSIPVRYLKPTNFQAN